MSFRQFAIVVAMFATLVYVVNRELAAVTPDVSNSRASSMPDVRRVDWPTLRRPPSALADIDGKTVAIPGYIVPLEDNAGRTSEFLLVPYFGACVHTPPPPPNQMVYVKMSGLAFAEPSYRPVWVHGVLKVSERKSPYGQVAYQMEGDHLEMYREQ